MKMLVTEEYMDELELLDRQSKKVGGRTLSDMVDLAFKERSKAVFKLCHLYCAVVVLGKRFGVKKAEVLVNGV